MALCKDCIHNEVCDRLYELNGIPKIGGTDCGCFKDKSDVAPKSEVVELEKTLAKCLPSYCQVMTEKKVMEIGRSQGAKTALLELKKQVHDHAVYPHNAGIDAYITLKAFDLVLNNFMKNYGR